jgi:hypothetical protein
MRATSVPTPTDPGAAVARYRERYGIGDGANRAGPESLADALHARAGITERQVDSLFAAGCDTRRAIEAATVPELIGVDRIRPMDATRIVRTFDEADDGSEEDRDDQGPSLGELFG